MKNNLEYKFTSLKNKRYLRIELTSYGSNSASVSAVMIPIEQLVDELKVYMK